MTSVCCFICFLEFEAFNFQEVGSGDLRQPVCNPWFTHVHLVDVMGMDLQKWLKIHWFSTGSETFWNPPWGSETAQNTPKFKQRLQRLAHDPSKRRLAEIQPTPPEVRPIPAYGSNGAKALPTAQTTTGRVGCRTMGTTGSANGFDMRRINVKWWSLVQKLGRKIPVGTLKLQG